MTKTRTQTSVEVARAGMQTRSQSPKTSAPATDTNSESRVTGEKSSAAETTSASQAQSATKVSTTLTKAKGKQRRVKRSTAEADSEDDGDLESTDSEGPQKSQAKASQAESLRIADTNRHVRARPTGMADTNPDDNVTGDASTEAVDVIDLRQAVQQLAVAVAEIRRERQLAPAGDNIAAIPAGTVKERDRVALRTSGEAARQRRRPAAPRVANRSQYGTGRERKRSQHEMERERSRQRQKTGRRRSSGKPRRRRQHCRSRRTRNLDESGDSSGNDFSGTSAGEPDHGWRRSQSQRQPILHYRRVARQDDPSPSSDGSSSESSEGADQRRSNRESQSPRQPRRQPNDTDNSDCDDDDSRDDDESSRSGSERSRSESRERLRRRERHQQRGHRKQHGRRERYGRGRSEAATRGQPLRPGNIKNLELPVFTPAPGVSAATWVDRVDLALQGARASGQGEWSDHALYFILGNKLMESAAMWWVTMNQRLTRRQQTWTYLKKELLKRFGPRKNKAAAEWRVNNRTMLNGESYDDFAAGLRRAADRNRVSERVFLAQYYRNLDKTTRQLVKMEPRPKTLEEAVAKTNRIDDPADNIAQGMRNIGQAFPMAPQTQLATVAGTMGQTVVIPGVGGMSLPAELTEAVVNSTAAAPANKDAVTVFTNQQGIWNDYAGIYEKPPGRKWNGRFWEKVATKRKVIRSPSTLGEAKKPRTKRAREDSGDENTQEKTEPRKRKTPAKTTIDTERKAVARVGAVRQQTTNNTSSQVCFRCGAKDHHSSQCTVTPECYACHKPGHFAKECTDATAKAKNDEYLKQRAARNLMEPGNGRRTP